MNELNGEVERLEDGIGALRRGGRGGRALCWEQLHCIPSLQRYALADPRPSLHHQG